MENVKNYNDWIQLISKSDTGWKWRHKFIKELLPIGSVLDVGCGNCDLMNIVDGDYYGIDFMSREYFPGKKYFQINLNNFFDIEQIPQVETICCIGLLEYLSSFETIKLLINNKCKNFIFTYNFIIWEYYANAFTEVELLSNLSITNYNKIKMGGSQNIYLSKF